MNKEPLEHAIVGLNPDVAFDENGKPEGLYMDILEVLAEFLRFSPIVNTNATTFDQHIKLVGDGTTRFGSPQAVSFQ